MAVFMILSGFFNTMALSQSSPGLKNSALGLLINLAPFIFLFFLMYLLFILPQQKQQKKHRQMISQLKAGDKVITNSGFYGTIVKVEDQSLKVRLGEKVIVTMDKNAIAGLRPNGGEGD